MSTWSEQPIESVPLLFGYRHQVGLRQLYERDSAANLFALAWLENYGPSANRPELYSFRGFLHPGSERVSSAALLISRRLLLVESGDLEEARRLGQFYGHQALSLQHIVSAKRVVEPFWEGYRLARGGLEARLIASQRMYVLPRERWLGSANPRPGAPSGVRLATMDDLEALYLASAQMHLEETGEDPLDLEPDAFRQHVRHRIETRRSFVWFDGHRRLLFKADISARCSLGVQISGVFTDRLHRGQGVGTRAMHDICERLVEAGTKRISLYVNQHNAPAIRLYERIGFLRHVDYQTIFLKRR